ncbi:MAG: zinc-dependent alcohol dehydrogenase family protein [Opitutaceae bacterium]|nr:zinc-dependent alcohol dehydrogenase family protein [Opitutaceae bacterium]
MLAMVLSSPGQPLRAVDRPRPRAGAGQLLVRVTACAVCRTDLHVVDGDLPRPSLPLVPGHEIVGRVEQAGPGVDVFRPGERVGVPWLAWTCGECRLCRAGRENLCPRARFTGYTWDGGFAEYMVADARFCLRLPDAYADAAAAPLLCAGLIGYRCLRRTGDAARLGLYGFGAAAHLVTQVARHQGRSVYAFTRPGDTAAQEFAVACGAGWAGDSTAGPPEELDAAIIFAPAGELVPPALRAVGPGGIVVCGGIHMSPVPSFPYALLWQERTVCSVANLTRRDGAEFMGLAAHVALRSTVRTYPLAEANTALADLRAGRFRGAAVLLPG